MGMTIDEIIKYLPAPICSSTVIDSEKQKEYEAHDKAVIIMRKYQKIEQIINETDFIQEDVIRYKMICKVIEDGNDI